MSRSNGSAQGARGQQGWPQDEVDAHGRPIDPATRWPAPQGHPAQGQPQQGYAQPGYPPLPAGYAADPHAQGYQGSHEATHGSGEPHPAYRHEYPTAPPQGHHHADPYAAQHGYPQHAPDPGVRSGMAAHYERYQPAANGAPQGYDRFDTQLHLDPQSQSGHGYPTQGQGFGGHDPEPELPRPHGGYATQSHPGPHGDPRGWDLSQYSPQGHGAPQAGPASPGYAGYPGPEPQAYGHDAYARAPQDPHWQQDHQGWPPQGGEQGYDHAGYPAHGGQQGHPAHGDPAPGYDPAEHDANLEEEAEPRRRGPSAMLVVGALVGAIALGGGLAYGYKKFGGTPTVATAKTPIVKAEKAPAKVKPAEPGGKEQPHTDKKILSRFGEDKPATETAQAPAPGGPQTEADGGPRKVTTVIVNRDGTITPAAPPTMAVAPAAPERAQPLSTVPGMVVQGVPPRPEMRPAQTEAPPIVVQTGPGPTRVTDLPLPKVKADAPAAPTPAPRKKVATRDDLVEQQRVAAVPPASPTPAAAPAATGGNGYVAVLTSRKSREDALKSFADLHQKYAEVLGTRPPDVREVNLGEKGVWYRLIVGPPGSREAAANLCKQLKDQGFQGCFQMAY